MDIFEIIENVIKHVFSKMCITLFKMSDFLLQMRLLVPLIFPDVLQHFSTLINFLSLMAYLHVDQNVNNYILSTLI